MTIGTEWKQILRFSLPIMLGHALQQLYNAVDSIVVGNFAGATKAIKILAAIGGGVALMFLFLAMAVGLGMEAHTDSNLRSQTLQASGTARPDNNYGAGEWF